MPGPSVPLTLVLMAAMLLAGCTGSDEDPRPDAAMPGPMDAVAFRAASFGDGPAALTTAAFDGTFAFHDNAQYVGEVVDLVGLESTSRQLHDITDLMPAGQPWAMHVSVDGDTGDGDLDLYFEEQGPVTMRWCDCPFGGHNDLYAYGIGGGRVVLGVQFDEIHGDPTDTAIPLQGFDYHVEVTIATSPRMLPPGIPVAVRLTAVGDEVRFANHTQTITVYGPDDDPVGSLAPGEGSFVVEEGAPTGEYVFIQRLDGAPMDASVATTGPLAVRLLTLLTDFVSTPIADGQPGTMTFDAPATVIAVGACAFAGDVEVDPAFEVLDPTGSVWAAASTGGPSIGGWGACFNNWPGDGQQQPGTWTARFTDTLGTGREIQAWTTSYQR